MAVLMSKATRCPNRNSLFEVRA